jgi:Fe-S cluster assembly iron-binding protein IscA
MALDEPNDLIKTYTVNEIEMMIGDDVLPFTEGTTLDFINDARGQGFILGPTDGGDRCC